MLEGVRGRQDGIFFFNLYLFFVRVRCFFQGVSFSLEERSKFGVDTLYGGRGL